MAKMNTMSNGAGDPDPGLARGPNDATRAQGETDRPESAGAKVVVANKLPMSLRARNFEAREVPYQQRDGSVKMVVEHVPREGALLFHGSAAPRTGMPRHRILHGYGFTEGVPREAYEEWAKDNKDQPFILNSIVFAESSLERAEARAKENAGRRTNMEKLDPEGGDPRMSASIATADNAS